MTKIVGKRVFRQRKLPSAEAARDPKLRELIRAEFPPAKDAGRKESQLGISSQIREAREAHGLTWYALAKLAGISNPKTVRDIEYGHDAQVSNVQAVADCFQRRATLERAIGGPLQSATLQRRR
jgi:hypothetical protein